MTPQQLMDLELAADQARDAVRSLLECIGDPPVLTPEDGLRVVVNTAAIQLGQAAATIGALRCARRPCDRVDGICPRCFPEDP